MSDITEQQPERFRRALRAGCSKVRSWPCKYPDCQCDELYAIRTKFARAAILAWEAPQRLGDRAPEAPR